MVSASFAFTRLGNCRLSLVFGIVCEYVRFQLCIMVSFVHSGINHPRLQGRKLIGLGSNRDLHDSIGSLLEKLARFHWSCGPDSADHCLGGPDCQADQGSPT